MIPGKDPTSARISGTARNRGKKIENNVVCSWFSMNLHIKLEINVILVVRLAHINKKG